MVVYVYDVEPMLKNGSGVTKTSGWSVTVATALSDLSDLDRLMRVAVAAGHGDDYAAQHVVGVWRAELRCVADLDPRIAA